MKLLNRIIFFGVIAGFIGVIVLIYLLKTGQSAFDRNAAQSEPKVVSSAPDTAESEKKPSQTTAVVPPSVSPGKEDVLAVMEKYRLKGCTNVLHPAVKVKGTVAWAPAFPDDYDKACLLVIAATGDPAKGLVVVIRKPDGDKVEDRSPVPIVEYIYCAESAGRHSVNVHSPTNEVYTFAAIDCPKAIADELLKQKSGQ